MGWGRCPCTACFGWHCEGEGSEEWWLWWAFGGRSEGEVEDVTEEGWVVWAEGVWELLYSLLGGGGEEVRNKVSGGKGSSVDGATDRVVREISDE